MSTTATLAHLDGQNTARANARICVDTELCDPVFQRSDHRHMLLLTSSVQNVTPTE
jgi:hypothetical protein